MRGRITVNNGYSKTAFLYINKNGTVLNAKSFQYLDQMIGSTFLLSRNKEIVMTGTLYDYSQPGLFSFGTFIRLDSNLNILVSKRIFSNVTSSPSKIAEADDGGVFESGNFFHSNNYSAELYLKKYTYEGIVSNCPLDTAELVTAPVSFSPVAIPVTVTSPATTYHTPVYTEKTYALMQADVICNIPPNCARPLITGPQQICSSSLIYDYRIQKNAGCESSIQWSIKFFQCRNHNEDRQPISNKNKPA